MERKNLKLLSIALDQNLLPD